MYINPLINSSKTKTEKKFYSDCSSGDISAVKEFLNSEKSKKFDLNLRVAALWSLMNKEIDVTNYLIDMLDDENTYSSLLKPILYHNQTEQAMWLVRKGGTPDSYALDDAASNGMFSFISFLCSTGYDINNYAHTTLCSAARADQVELTKYLLKKADNDIYLRNGTPFISACKNKSEELIRLYLDMGFRFKNLDKISYRNFIEGLIVTDSIDFIKDIFNKYDLNIFDLFDESSAINHVRKDLNNPLVSIAIEQNVATNYLLNQSIEMGDEKSALMLINKGFYPVNRSIDNDESLRLGGFYRENLFRHEKSINTIVMKYLRMIGKTPAKALKEIPEGNNDAIAPLLIRYFRTNKNATMEKYLSKCPEWQKKVLTS